MGVLCSKASQSTEDENNYEDISNKSKEQIQKEFLSKYGRLDWGCEEQTPEDLAKAGKRYEGHQILMNLKSNHILNCKVIKVSEKGFLVEAYNISGFSESEPEKFDYSKPIPYSKFYHIFLES